MCVIVTGCGRSGTNIALQMLTGHPNFEPSEAVEDKKVFKTRTEYPLEYLTKCDTVYYNTYDIQKTMKLNPLLMFVWCIRDPRDMALSKLYRGRPESEGGDCKTAADDATCSGMLSDIARMTKMCGFVVRHHTDNILLNKMELAILNTDMTAKRMCEFLGVDYYGEMLDFPGRMRNRHKRQRYGNKVDKSQVGLYKNWETVYGGWFKGREFSGKSIPDIFEALRPFCKEFGYDT